MAADELNIANAIIISMHYEDKRKKRLSRSKNLESQSPFCKDKSTCRQLNMRLTISADAEGYYTINPPGQFVCPGYISPKKSPMSLVQIRLENDIDDIVRGYDGNHRAAVPAISVEEARRQGLTSGISATSISCHEDRWGNCTGCREHC